MNTSSLQKTRYLLRIFLKLAVVVCSIGGILLALSQAVDDGYSHWGRRLLYFTTFSNVCLGFTFLPLLFCTIFKKKIGEFLFLAKYASTVCITLTFLVFSFLLVPFADASYHLDRFSSMLTHFFSPIFAIVDFFFEKSPYRLKRKQCLLCALPPLFYTTLSLSLSFLSIDFGRGDNYPYIFFNPFTKAKMFGFSREIPFTGTFYWIAFLAFLVCFVGLIFVILQEINIKNRAKK